MSTLSGAGQEGHKQWPSGARQCKEESAAFLISSISSWGSIGTVDGVGPHDRFFIRCDVQLGVWNKSGECGGSGVVDCKIGSVLQVAWPDWTGLSDGVGDRDELVNVVEGTGVKVEGEGVCVVVVRATQVLRVLEGMDLALWVVGGVSQTK